MNNVTSGDQTPLPPENRNDGRVIALLRHFFHSVFCVEEAITPKQQTSVGRSYFFSWLVQHLADMSDADIDNVCNKLQVSEAEWLRCGSLVTSNACVEIFTELWPLICFPNTPLMSPLQSVSLQVMLHFADGTIAPNMGSVATQSATVIATDGNVIWMLTDIFKRLTDWFTNVGVDQVYRNARRNDLDDADRSVLTTLFEHLQKEYIPSLDPVLAVRMERYVRLIRQMLVVEKEIGAAENVAHAANPQSGGWNN